MIQFLFPAALLAAAGIIVPLLLHLWRPPARTVRLGSLRFLETVPGRRLRDLRWRERLLLLLRATLLLALAALLAGPLWMERGEGPQRWALLAPDAVLDESAGQAWRELLAQGYQPRRLASGFPDATDTSPASLHAAMDVWSLLREADARVPAGSKLVVFAPPRVTDLQGARPALAHSEVRWIPTPTGDAVSAAWIVPNSVLPSGRGIRATIGKSNAKTLRFFAVATNETTDSRTISDPASRTDLFIRNISGEIAVRLIGAKPEKWVPLSVYRPIRVAIVHGPQRTEDARYVAAAVQAVSEFSDRPVTVEIREETASAVLPEADWLFRLGTSPLTPSMSTVLAENRVNVVTDAPHDSTQISRPTWFVAPGDQIGFDEIRLWRRAETSDDAAAMIWSDGFGNPLLSFAREGRAKRWRFFSRFHPDSNDWVSRGAFPAWIRQLLLGEPEGADIRSRDLRLADVTQIQTARASSGAVEAMLPPATGRSTDLRTWLWVLTALLLGVERVVSLRGPQPRESTPAALAKRESEHRAEVVR